MGDRRLSQKERPTKTENLLSLFCVNFIFNLIYSTPVSVLMNDLNTYKIDIIDILNHDADIYGLLLLSILAILRTLKPEGDDFMDGRWEKKNTHSLASTSCVYY